MRYIYIFFICLLLSLALTINVFALSPKSTSSLSAEESAVFLEHAKISSLAYEPSPKDIVCFDVNEFGMFAIGCSESIRKTVCVYSNTGDFCYGYSFECYGSFVIDLNENSICIYFVRSNIIVNIDTTGQIKSILNLPKSAENNSYWTDHLYSTQRQHNGMEYVLKNNHGLFNAIATSYSQLIAIDSGGNEHILYDSGSTSSGIPIVFLLPFAFLVVIPIVVYSKKTMDSSHKC